MENDRTMFTLLHQKKAWVNEAVILVDFFSSPCDPFGPLQLLCNKHDNKQLHHPYLYVLLLLI
jgi:hypothetical protein